MTLLAHIDFGYPWWLSYGHLAVLAVAFSLLLLGLRLRWSKWTIAILGFVAVWAVAGFLIVRIGLNVNGHAPLPTESFLRSGTGRVLDMGAGTGQSSIMVLEARSETTLVALDLSRARSNNTSEIAAICGNV